MRLRPTRLRSAGLAVRRVRQTFTAFDNGGAILLALARKETQLRLHTRTGLNLVVPNVPGARFPIYETHADDIYRLDSLLAGLGESPVIMDIGAHVGGFATAVGAVVPGARVHAFEASPSTAGWLRVNIERNGLQNQVVVHNVAVSDHHGTLEMIDNGHASAHNGLTAPEGSGARVQIPCIPFSEAVKLSGERVDVVKIDAEGAEYGIILGGSPELWSSVRRVVMEYHPVEGRSFDELAAFFSRAGLEVSRQVPITGGLGSAWFTRVDTGGRKPR